MTPEVARQLGLPSSITGVVATAVDPSSPAAAAGIERGDVIDVIQEVNRKPVHNLAQYQQATTGTENQPILLLVNRGGTTHYVVVEPQ